MQDRILVFSQGFMAGQACRPSTSSAPPPSEPALFVGLLNMGEWQLDVWVWSDGTVAVRWGWRRRQAEAQQCEVVRWSRLLACCAGMLQGKLAGAPPVHARSRCHH